MELLTLIDYILKAKKKIASLSSDLQFYRKWFTGEPTSFHKYTIYNGKKTIRKVRLSMRMAKQVSQDWASLLMNEKVQIGVKSQELLDKELTAYNFRNKTNKGIEYAFGLSMTGLVVDIDKLLIELKEGEQVGQVKVTKDTKVSYSVYSALKTIPITFENDDVTECAFIQENTEFDKIVAHVKDENGLYKIIVAKVNKQGATEEIYEIETGTDEPLFAIVHPQIANNIDVDSPYPIPIYANAIDTMQGLDAMFDSYVNEFLLGRKRIFVSSELNKIDKDTGNVESGFDTNDAVYNSIPKAAMLNAQNGNPFIYVSNDELRAQQHSQAIQDLLNFFSKQCELGVDYYRFEKGRVMTATQVISEKSDTFRNLRKHEGVVEKAIRTIIRGLMYAHNTFTLSDEKYEDIDDIYIKFDDSIIEDKATEKENDKKDVELGAMSLVAYRMKWFAEDEETANESVKKIYGDADFYKRLANFSPFLVQGTITPLQFVKMVYLDVKGEAEQNALAEEIKANLKSGGEVFSDAELMNLRGAL